MKHRQLYLASKVIGAKQAEKELLWLVGRVSILQQITEELCQERIKSYGE